MTKDCARAIKISVEKLKVAGLNMTNIQFHAITGNSGGDSAVGNIHPPLRANKLMSKDSKKLN